MYKICIKYNNTHVRFPCGICGLIKDKAEIPLDLFLDNPSYDKRPGWVCPDCGEDLAEELYELLQLFYKSDIETLIRQKTDT